MNQYVYAFNRERRDEELFFVFPRFPEIVSAVPLEVFKTWDAEMIQSHAEDAVLTALQSVVLARDDIPEPDDYRYFKADGFVHLSTTQSMKLELARVFASSCKSVAEFARRINKHDTAARRLLNLRHPSANGEIDEAFAAFGKRLYSQWESNVIAYPPAKHSRTGA